MRWCSSEAARAASRNTRATTLELYEGLVARSQNCWPSVNSRCGRDRECVVATVAGGLLPQDVHVAADAEVVALAIEHLIRRAAGMGRASYHPDPGSLRTSVRALRRTGDRRRFRRLGCGARCAATGARVIVCQQTHRFGGNAAADWRAETIAALSERSDVTLLPRTTAFGYYDGNLVGAIERVTDHLSQPPAHAFRASECG